MPRNAKAEDLTDHEDLDEMMEAEVVSVVVDEEVSEVEVDSVVDVTDPDPGDVTPAVKKVIWPKNAPNGNNVADFN